MDYRALNALGAWRRAYRTSWINRKRLYLRAVYLNWGFRAMLRAAWRGLA